MHVIKCPNFRPKTVKLEGGRKEHLSRAECNHVLGFVDDLRDASAIFSCSACHTYHRLKIDDKKAVLQLIAKNSELKHNNVLEYETRGYQTKGY